MKMTIGAAMAMALMLSLPLATLAQEVPPAPTDAADVSAGAVDTAAQEAENASNTAIDAADNASDAAGYAIENSADEATDAADEATNQIEDRTEKATEASDNAQNRANDEAKSSRDGDTNRKDDLDRNAADSNAQSVRNNQAQQPYTTGYRGDRQTQNYNNQAGQQVHEGHQQGYHSNGQQGYAGQQTAHHEGADHGWGEQHPSVGQQEWMCIDGRRTLVTIVSVSPSAVEECPQNYPERSAQYEVGQQPMPAAPENFEADRNVDASQSDRNDSQNDRSTPPPVPQSNDDAVQQAPTGSQPTATDQSAGPADGSFEGAADRNGGRIEATEIRD